MFNLSVHFKLDGKSLVVQLATLRTNNVIFFFISSYNLKQKSNFEEIQIWDFKYFYLVRNAKKDLHHIGKHYSSRYDHYKQKLNRLSPISSQGFDSFTCSIIKVRGGDDCQSRLLDDLLSVVHICPLQADHKGDLKRFRCKNISQFLLLWLLPSAQSTCRRLQFH